MELDYGKLCLDRLCSKSFEGRKVGTDGWELAYRFLMSEVTEMGYNPSIQQFQTEKGTEISSILVTIPGAVDSTIIVGAHFDGAQRTTFISHYPAANDNGSGTVTLLLLLKDMFENFFETDKTVVIAFWGNEEVFEGAPFRASKHFTQELSTEDKKRTLLYINVDTMGHKSDKNKMLLDHSSEKRVRNEAERIKSNGRFNYVLNERLKDMYSDFASFFYSGIPYLNYHDYCEPSCEHPVHTTIDTPEFISIEQLFNVSQDIQDIIKSY